MLALGGLRLGCDVSTGLEALRNPLGSAREAVPLPALHAES